MHLMMPVSWTSGMTWLANGVPATVARLGGRLRVSLYFEFVESLKSHCIFVRSLTYMLSDVAAKNCGSGSLLIWKDLISCKPIFTVLMPA